MTLINDAAHAWSAPVVLAQDEVWQAREGRVFLTTTISPATEDGFSLHEGQAVRFSTGLQVRYRKTGTGTTLIVREAV